MRRKTKGYLILGICGVMLLLSAVLLGKRLSNLGTGVLCGVGSMAAALGAAKFLMGRFEERYPDQMKQNEIDTKDERNTAIRQRAQAQAGVVLQWLVIGMAWLSILFDGPLWITLSAIGVFCGKTVLEAVLMGYYQRRM